MKRLALLLVTSAFLTFVIAGEDQQWKPAQARIEGDKVIVTSADVKQPAAAPHAFSLPRRRGEGGRRPDEGWGRQRRRT